MMDDRVNFNVRAFSFNFSRVELDGRTRTLRHRADTRQPLDIATP